MINQHGDNCDDKYPNDLSVLKRIEWGRNTNFFLNLLRYGRPSAYFGVKRIVCFLTLLLALLFVPLKIKLFLSKTFEKLNIFYGSDCFCVMYRANYEISRRGLPI